MMKLLLVLIFGTLSLSSYAQIINIYSLGNGQMKVTGQGFIARGNQNYFINYWKNDRRIGSGNTSLSGSFEYTSGPGVFQKGDRLIVKVMNFKGSGSHFVRSAAYAETPRNDDEITDERIKKYANKQANRVANRVKNTLGEQERFKYNLTRGFWEGYSLYKRYEGRYDRGYSDYQRGLEQGLRIGKSEGAAKGLDHANSVSQGKAYTEVHSRFAAALDGGELNTDVGTVSTPPYAGDNPPYQSAPSIEDKLEEMQDDFERSIRDYYRYADQWNLRKVFSSSGDYNFIKSYFRSEYALNEWSQNRLGGNYKYGLYKKMNSEQKLTFEKYFKNRYDNIIDRKFYEKLREYHAQAHAIGLDYGYRAGAEMAYRTGLLKGKKGVYKHSSISSYDNNYKSLYSEHFGKRVDFYKNNPVLKHAQMQISGNYLPGGSLNISVKNLVNYGGVSANIDLKVGSSDQFVVNGKRLSFQLEALSTLKSEVVFENVAKIQNSVTPDTSHKVPVEITNYGVYDRLSFAVSWDSIIKSFGKLEFQSSSYKTTKSYIVSKLKEEWEQLVATKPKKKAIWYTARKPDGQMSLLEKLVREYEATSVGRQNYEDLADTDLCKMASGHKWIMSRSKYYSGKAFKEVFNRIDKNCD